MPDTPYKQLESMIRSRQNDMYKEINKEYRESIKAIDKEIEAIIDEAEYDKDGNLKNERKLSKKIAMLTPIIAMLWNKNRSMIEQSSSTIMRETTLFYEFLSVTQLGNTRVIQSPAEINRMVSSILKERSNIIKWDQVIKGNARVLDKRLQKLVKNEIAKGKTKFQIERKIQKTMRLNSGKARTIARTESNYYYSRSKYITGKMHEEEGNTIIKQWEYTFLSREPRDEHQVAHGQTVVGIDTRFIVGGRETLSPQQFGIAEEDINCNCTYIMRYLADTVRINYGKYAEYKDNK